MMVEEYNHREEMLQDRAITAAYLAAAWQRAKKMPPLQSVLQRNKPKEPQTPQQMLAMIQVMHAAMGGKTVYKS